MSLTNLLKNNAPVFAAAALSLAVPTTSYALAPGSSSAPAAAPTATTMDFGGCDDDVAYICGVEGGDNFQGVLNKTFSNRSDSIRDPSKWDCVAEDLATDMPGGELILKNYCPDSFST